MRTALFHLSFILFVQHIMCISVDNAQHCRCRSQIKLCSDIVFYLAACHRLWQILSVAAV